MYAGISVRVPGAVLTGDIGKSGYEQEQQQHCDQNGRQGEQSHGAHVTLQYRLLQTTC